MFTRQHYVKVAKIVKKGRTKADRSRQAKGFATMFKKDNKRFDRDRFLVACGVKKAKPKKRAKRKTRRKR